MPSVDCAQSRLEGIHRGLRLHRSPASIDRRQLFEGERLILTNPKSGRSPQSLPAQAGEERLMAWLRLAQTPCIGPRAGVLLREALNVEGLALETFIEWPAARRDRFWRGRGGARFVPGLPFPSRRDVMALRKTLCAHGVSWAGAESPDYPRRLIEPDEPPFPVMFWRGDAALLDAMPTVGMAGRVHCSALGARLAREIGCAMAAAGRLVVSGLARGVDQAAHRGALDGGGWTAAFLPAGILAAAFPSDLAGALRAGRLALFSPWPPEAPFTPAAAVRRNALIAAAADGLIAVEMGIHGGGTRHTVEAARRRRRPIWALAYAKPPAECGGNAALLRAVARPLPVDADGALDAAALAEARRALFASRDSIRSEPASQLAMDFEMRR